MPFARPILASLVLASAAAQAAPSAAQDSPGAVVALDGSGSMWGELAPRRPKFDAVRDAFKASLGAVSPKAQIGVMAFGHRRKADCQDVELIAPPEAGLGARAALLDPISPKGKGPIAHTLGEAAKAAAAAKANAIVLVYDGPDNCQQDVCAAAQAIAVAQPGLAVHAIGVGPDPKLLQPVACVAKLTGGKSFEARDEAGLKLAFEQAFEAAGLDRDSLDKAPPAPQRVAPDLAAASGPPRVRLTAHLKGVDAPIDAPVEWTVRQEGVGKVAVEKTAREISQGLAPGVYEVSVRAGLATAKRAIEVAEKGLTDEKIELDAGAVRIRSGRMDGQGDPILTIAGADGGEGGRRWVAKRSDAETILPAGRYRLAAARGLSRRELDIAIAAGETQTVDLALNAGSVTLSAAERENGERIDGVSYRVWTDDPEAANGRREVARSLARSPSFDLPPGTYYVAAKLGTAEAREQIAVSANSAAEKTLVIPIARVSLSANLKGEQPAGLAFSYRVFRAADGGEVARSASANPEFVLEPGRYRIDVTAGEQNAGASQTLDLPAGGRKEVPFAIEAACVTLRAGAQPAPLDGFWEVKDASGHSIWRTTRPNPEGCLAPGTYAIRFESRSLRLERTVSVAGGERREIDVNAE